MLFLIDLFISQELVFLCHLLKLNIRICCMTPCRNFCVKHHPDISQYWLFHLFITPTRNRILLFLPSEYKLLRLGNETLWQVGHQAASHNTVQGLSAKPRVGIMSGPKEPRHIPNPLQSLQNVRVYTERSVGHNSHSDVHMLML